MTEQEATLREIVANLRKIIRRHEEIRLLMEKSRTKSQEQIALLKELRLIDAKIIASQNTLVRRLERRLRLCKALKI